MIERDIGEVRELSFKSAKATPVVPAPLFPATLGQRCPVVQDFPALPALCPLCDFPPVLSRAQFTLGEKLGVPGGCRGYIIRDTCFSLEFEIQIIYTAVRPNDCILNQSVAASVMGQYPHSIQRTVHSNTS